MSKITQTTNMTHTNQLIEEYDYFELPKGMDRVEGTKFSDNYPPMNFLAKQINLKKLLSQTEQECDKKWKLKLEYIKETAENCAILASDIGARNIRNNIIKPIDDLLNNK